MSPDIALYGTASPGIRYRESIEPTPSRLPQDLPHSSQVRVGHQPTDGWP